MDRLARRNGSVRACRRRWHRVRPSPGTGHGTSRACSGWPLSDLSPRVCSLHITHSLKARRSCPRLTRARLARGSKEEEQSTRTKEKQRSVWVPGVVHAARMLCRGGAQRYGVHHPGGSSKIKARPCRPRPRYLSSGLSVIRRQERRSNNALALSCLYHLTTIKSECNQELSTFLNVNSHLLTDISRLKILECSAVHVGDVA